MIPRNPIIAALALYGESPVPGPNANPQILAFLDATTYPENGSDEVPWCSAFLVWIFQQCGIQTTANAAALSWMTFGVDTDQPQLGDIVVLGWPQPTPVNHHVGIFIREKAEVVYILAGNQHNEVDIVAWRKQDVLSYRHYDLPS